MRKARNAVLFSVFVFGILLMVTVSACSKKETAQAGLAAAGEYRDTLNVGIGDLMTSWDLHRVSTNTSKQILSGMVIERLATLNDKGEVVPELAERWENSEDGRTITFYLRRGVKFHDGTPFKADDVVSSMNRWIEAFTNAQDIAGDSRFEKIDDYTVRIVLPSPGVTFVDVIAGAGQPAGITTVAANNNEDSNGFWKEIIGTGPYRFKEKVQDQYILLERYEDYQPYGTPENLIDGWAGYKLAPTKYVYWWYAPEESTRIVGLETGQYDAIFGVTQDYYDRLKAAPGVVVEPKPNGTATLSFNKRIGPCRDVNLRKAINYAIDNEALLKVSYRFYYLTPSYMQTTQSYFTEAGKEYYNQHDLAKAREYLAQSSYNGETLRVLGNANMSPILQQQLAEIGIKTSIIEGQNVQIYRNDPKNWDLLFGGWIQHPIPPLKPFLAAEFAGWQDDPKFQNYLKEFYAARTFEEAKAIWEETQLYCWRDYLPIILLGQQDNIYAWRDTVEGIAFKEGMLFWNTKVRN
jgi:peptide/nickel transport system substrate-binding protein